MVGSFEEYMQDVEHGVYDFTKDGKCIGCGECCSNILPLSESEIRTIRHYMKVHKIKEQKILAPYVALDMTCPFLDKSKEKDRCTIYEVRPQICRSFICSKFKLNGQFDPELFKERMFMVDMREMFFRKHGDICN